MEKFLEELRQALEEAKVENKDEILATYLEHFALGHEAGMTDEEIIERFDEIEEIVWKHQSHKKNNGLVGLDLILDLVSFSDFKIVNKKDITGIQFDLDEDSLKYVTILREENKIHLKSEEIKSWSKRKR